MTRMNLPFIHRFKDRHGHVRHYFRRPGFKRMALPGAPGSAEFLAAYQLALSGSALPIGATRTGAGTVSAMAVVYYQSAAWKALAPTTQATYRNLIEGFRAEHGDKPVSMMKPEHVRKLIAAKAATPSAANAMLKMLRLMVREAIADGWSIQDPTIGVRRVKTGGDGWHAWTEAEIAQYEAHWPAGSRERLALSLLLFTCQRKGDVVRMGRQHVQDGVLTVRQQKTGTRLAIPVHPVLRADIGLLPSGQLTFLMTQAGVPFTSAGFGNWFVERARMAGLPAGCSAHGLRKAGARRLAEAGCTAHEIMAIGGWKTLKEVERYTRAADQSRLAIRAISRIRENETGS